MSLLRRSHEICAVDLLRLAGFHQPVCLSLFLLFLGAAINLGTLAQAAAGTRLVNYPPHLHSEARRKLRFHFLRGLPFFSLGVNTSKLACVHALCLLARSQSWRAQPCACFHLLTRGSPLGHEAPIQCCLRKQIQIMFERYLGSALLIL